MQVLDLVGYTADLAHIVLVDPSTGERFRTELSAELLGTIAEMLESGEDDARVELLRAITGAALHDVHAPAATAEAPSPAAALVSLGRAGAEPRTRTRMDGTGSRLTPSEIQRLLRSGKAPEAVAEQAGMSLDWVLRWYQPIEAEQRKVITSVLGSRQDRDGFGRSDDLIGEAVRANLLQRDIEPDGEDLQWTAARPDGRPYWTVTLRYKEADRVRRATWRYDIGTGRVSPRDDLAVDLGWTAPITHPSPGREHQAGTDPVQTPPRAAPPPPPPVRSPARWEPPAPPSRRRR